VGRQHRQRCDAKPASATRRRSGMRALMRGAHAGKFASLSPAAWPSFTAENEACDHLGPTAHTATCAPRRSRTRSVAMSAGLSGLHVSRGRGGPYRVDRTDRCESRAGRRGWLSVRVCQLSRGEVEGRSRSRPTSIQRPSRCTTQAAGAEQASGRLVDTDSRRPRVSFQGCRVVVPHDSRTPHSRSHGAL